MKRLWKRLRKQGIRAWKGLARTFDRLRALPARLRKPPPPPALAEPVIDRVTQKKMKALAAEKQALKELVRAQKEEHAPLRRINKQLAYVIRSVTAINEHGSLTPGRRDWAERWRAPKGKRVLYFVTSDYSGSFYRWAEAVNKHTDHAVRVATLFRHRYGYPLDILFMRGDLLPNHFPEMMNSLYQLADEADIIHIKDQAGFFNGRNSLPKDTLSMFGKPIVYTLYGGTARHDEADPVFRDYVRSHPAVVAMTPDLCFDWLDSVFIPHTIDADAFPYQWTDGRLILHTPSTPARKGTDIFRVAAERVAGEVGGQVEIITNMTHGYVMSKKPTATLFFDQAGKESESLGAKYIGWYGNSALEAAVFGVPTMAYLSPDALRQAKRSGFADADACAILNSPPTEEGLYRTMRDFFAQGEGGRHEASLRTRKWIEDHHSYQATARQLDRMYRSL